jgi:hypothetical protein
MNDEGLKHILTVCLCVLFSIIWQIITSNHAHFLLHFFKPKTIQQNTIIEHTASRVALNNQLEVFLKAKQANNSNFAFFNPTDVLHGYYLYLRGKYSRNDEDQNNVSPKEGSGDGNDSDGCNPLSGLLGGYSSSSNESEGPLENEDNSNIKDSTCENERQDENDDDIRSEEQERKRKADRLERLRIWKESRSG